MHRVTEPELMLSSDQVLAYAQADFSETENDVISRICSLVRNIGLKVNKHTVIVDLGCGPGNIAEKISITWPNAKVFGLDDSQAMLDIANERKKRISKQDAFGNLVYRKVNISSIAKGNNPFFKFADIVISNSLIHHIHDPDIFFEALVSISKKGAVHFHRDLRRPFDKKELERIQEEYLINAPAVLRKDFIASLKAAHTLSEINDYINSRKLLKLKAVSVGDRYLDLIGQIY